MVRVAHLLQTPTALRCVTVLTFEEVLSGLLRASHRVHPEGIVPLLAEHLAQVAMDDVAIYLADPEQRVLVPVPGGEGPERRRMDIDDSPAGEAFRTERPVVGDPVGGTEASAGHPQRARMWFPLVDGAERLGVFAVTAATDALTWRRAEDVASVAASMVVSKLAYGDGLVIARRRKEMDVAAELRWSLLPPLTYVNDRVGISGLLEPAYEIAGDAFDYAVDGDLAHIAVFDAMGHGLEASRMANLAVGAYRNLRRQGAAPDELFTFVDETVRATFGPERFVTGHLAVLDTTTGLLGVINAGHPPPMLVRAGRVTDVRTPPRLPFGLGADETSSTELMLQPGDVVLFFTDGVTEARSTDGEVFGRGRLAELLGQSMGTDPLAETARRLCHAVLDHQQGRLQDDATLLLVAWYGA